MKTTKQLLILLRKEIEEDTKLWQGSAFMCILCSNLMTNKIITLKEYLLVLNYIESREPTNDKFDESGGWYPPLIKEPRIQWLNAEINKL